MSGLPFTVARKEVLDGLRDRRSLVSALLGALAGPLIAGLAIAGLARSEAERPLQVWLAAHEPHAATALVSFLEDHGARVEPTTRPVKAEVRAGRMEIALVIPQAYAQKFREGRPAPVQVVSDPSRAGSRADARRVHQLLAAFARQVGDLRLLARGISPDVVAAVKTESVDVSTERSRAAAALAVLPVFLLVSAFVAGMSLAIDATAGERERGSLEPLLLNPVPRRALVAGKWMATALLNGVGVVATLAVCRLVLERLPLEDMGVRLELGGADLLWALGAVLPLAGLAAALQLLVATGARSFKEGQTYLSMLLFVPMVAGMFLSFLPQQPHPWVSLVPVVGQHQLLSSVFRGEDGSLLGLLVAGGVALLTAYVCVRRTAALLGDEKIVLGR